MQCNNACLIDRLPQEVGYRPCDESIADPVETILAQLILRRNLRVDWICSHSIWDSGMEGSVKVSNVICFGSVCVQNLTMANAFELCNGARSVRSSRW